MGKTSVAAARLRLEKLSSTPTTPEELVHQALELASELFELSEERTSRAEVARSTRLSAMLDDPRGQLFGILLTDRVARDRNHTHTADQLRYLHELLGSPSFASAMERLQVELGVHVGRVAPRLVGGLVAAQIRSEVEGLVFPSEPRHLTRYLRARREAGVEVNLNYLGEEVLGEAQAQRRVSKYVELLERADVSTISVKLSSIFSQIDRFAWDATVHTLCERLRPIYRAALACGQHGHQRLVYLDMEAYEDLHLTLEVVRRLMDESELSSLTVGIVLQAYVPESATLQRTLSDWAMKRVANGGAPLRLRLVKGANLAAERVQSHQANWALPLVESKRDADANFLKMLEYGTRPEVARAVHLGVASHNVFDLAMGMALRSARAVNDYVGFEVLEGMANPTQRTLRELDAPVLVYAPIVDPAELESAVAYLVRRLDENTTDENFLRHAFSMQLHDEHYQRQRLAFLDAHQASCGLSEQPRRPSNRFTSCMDLPEASSFENEADTDFSSAANRRVVEQQLVSLHDRPAFDIASGLVEGPAEAHRWLDGFDPSRPGHVPYRMALASPADVQRAVQAARQSTADWQRVPVAERRRLVRELARLLRRRRAELTAAMLMDAAKRVTEGDAEVSEAIDFAEYYLRSIDAEQPPRAPLGVVTVASPWNFPLAIPFSGIIASLLAGNVVLFKPALESAYVGRLVAECAWQAGIPVAALQLLLCDEAAASPLIESPQVDAVILTGATRTAQSFLERRPGLRLFAETGGKNALIITGLADGERAVHDLVSSAFFHSGQKCSASSLAIVVDEVFEDPSFRRRLRDAASSLPVGSAWNPAHRVTPLIREPGPELSRGLTQLEDGESWLVQPQVDPTNPRCWSPGIRWDVRPGSFTQRTELFGPVLSVLRARDLGHAIELSNATPYGLVAGLHSLDEREQARFVDEVKAGNLYLNRTTTGAIVGRQPFGGCKASSIGPGAKAGGPNYVAQLQHTEPVEGAVRVQPFAGASSEPLERLLQAARKHLPSEELMQLQAGVADYEHQWDVHFARGHDPSQLLGQDNVFRYRPLDRALVMVPSGTSTVDLLLTCAAALVAGVPLRVATAGEGAESTAPRLAAIGAAAGFQVRVETLEQSLADVESYAPERIRWLGEVVPEPLLRSARALGVHVSRSYVRRFGRDELLHYHWEQTISLDYHRYGHLGLRSPGIGQLSGCTMSSNATFSPIGPAARGPYATTTNRSVGAPQPCSSTRAAAAARAADSSHVLR